MQTARLAPSPTGALHLGNARTFLVNWCLARRHGWKIIFRIEDLDGPRIKQGAAQQAIDDLRWLGLDWDEQSQRQSDRAREYQHAIEQLLRSGHAYPCVCSRREVDQAASAPHAEDGASIYPGTCRGRFASLEAARLAAGREPAIRFRVPDDGSAVIVWNDVFRGPQQIDSLTLGDFVIARGDRSAAYQLAVVVDDAETQVTQIVRGDDLVDSTPRQILVYRALGLADRIPQYCHLPLVIGPDGRRLAKRHGDSRLSYYRSLGVPAERILSLLGKMCGIDGLGDATTAGELLPQIRLEQIPRQPMVFTPEQDAWLRAGRSG
jgi:glutamyl-tRNA synthetase